MAVFMIEFHPYRSEIVNKDWSSCRWYNFTSFCGRMWWAPTVSSLVIAGRSGLFHNRYQCGIADHFNHHNHSCEHSECYQTLKAGCLCACHKVYCARSLVIKGLPIIAYILYLIPTYISMLWFTIRDHNRVEHTMYYYLMKGTVHPKLTKNTQWRSKMCSARPPHCLHTRNSRPCLQTDPSEWEDPCNRVVVAPNQNPAIPPLPSVRISVNTGVNPT